jgi:hypothetical protein
VHIRFGGAFTMKYSGVLGELRDFVCSSCRVTFQKFFSHSESRRVFPVVACPCCQGKADLINKPDTLIDHAEAA